MANPPSSDPDKVAGAKFRISALALIHGYTHFSVHPFIFVSMQEDGKAMSLSLADLL